MEGAFGVSILFLLSNFFSLSWRRRKEERGSEGICVELDLDQKNEEVAAKGTLNEDRILCEMVCEDCGILWDFGDDDRVEKDACFCVCVKVCG